MLHCRMNTSHKLTFRINTWSSQIQPTKTTHNYLMETTREIPKSCEIQQEADKHRDIEFYMVHRGDIRPSCPFACHHSIILDVVVRCLLLLGIHISLWTLIGLVSHARARKALCRSRRSVNKWWRSRGGSPA